MSAGEWLQPLIMIGITFLLTAPLIGVGIYQYNRNRLRHIIITFSGPDGTIKKQPLKIGLSWTIYFFGGWALLFRGQFIEWVIYFLSGILLSTIIAFNIPHNTPSPLPNELTKMHIYNWVIISVSLVAHSLLKDYYILIGNRIRLKKMHLMGYSFDNGLNSDVQGIYDYIKVTSQGVSYTSKDEMNPLGKNEVEGDKFRYVVPENKEVDENDYSNLTNQDLKLLLRSEGVPFDPSSDKEELLKLVDEYVKEDIVEDESFSDDELENLTIQDLKLSLKVDGIPFSSGMTKEELITLLKESKPTVKKETTKESKPKDKKESKPKDNKKEN